MCECVYVKRELFTQHTGLRFERIILSMLVQLGSCTVFIFLDNSLRDGERGETYIPLKWLTKVAAVSLLLLLGYSASMGKWKFSS